MKNKKIPQRMCVVTREKHDKKDLLRIVKDKDNNIFVDLSGKKNGKGAYITKSIEVLDKAIKSKILDRTFDVEIPNSLYDEIRKIIEEN